jgi:hypothetical protein
MADTIQLPVIQNHSRTSAKEQLLDKKEQFVGWITLMKSRARRFKYISEGKIVESKKIEYFDMLLDNVSIGLLGKLKITEGEPEKLIKGIEKIFGIRTPFESRNDFKKRKL